MIFVNESKIDAVVSQIAKEGNDCNGDGYYIYTCEEYFVCILADGLGSGQFAHESSKVAIDVVKDHRDENVKTLMSYCNKALQNKRGAAVLIVKIYFKNQKIEYCCVGNIRALLYAPSGKVTYPLPISGYLSGKPQSYRVQTYMYEPHSKFLIYTDGLRIKSAKLYLENSLPIEQAACRLKEHMDSSHVEDATFIIGSIK